MNQVRPLAVSVLGGLFGALCLLMLVIAVAILSGAIEAGTVRLLGQPAQSKVTAGLSTLVVSGLFFACAYGLWKLKRWGLYFTALIVLLMVVAQIASPGEGIISGQGWHLDLGHLLTLILLVALL